MLHFYYAFIYIYIYIILIMCLCFNYDFIFILWSRCILLQKFSRSFSLFQSLAQSISHFVLHFPHFLRRSSVILLLVRSLTLPDWVLNSVWNREEAQVGIDEGTVVSVRKFSTKWASCWNLLFIVPCFEHVGNNSTIATLLTIGQALVEPSCQTSNGAISFCSARYAIRNDHTELVFLDSYIQVNYDG